MLNVVILNMRISQGMFYLDVPGFVNIFLVIFSRLYPSISKEVADYKFFMKKNGQVVEKQTGSFR